MRNSLLVLFPTLGVLFLFFFLLCNIANPITKSTVRALNDKRVSMRLIHRNSLVPHCNVSDGPSFAMRSSIARYDYLKAKAKGIFFSKDDVRGDVIPSEDKNIFFVNISIGTPPIPQLVIMDTGSSLFWIQCEPCKNCKETPNPIYDPRKSSSYRTSACEQAYCSRSISGQCGVNRQCTYFVAYRGMAYTAGVLGYENVKFQTSDEGIVVVPSIVFGCGTDNNEVIEVRQSSGVLGLSADDSSILRSSAFKNTPKFSYCLGNASDPDYTYNQLILGNESILDGQPTPLLIRNGLYFVTLEGIKVGETDLQINPDEYKFGVLVDSGTTYSFLHNGTLDHLKEEVRKVLDSSFQSAQLEGSPDYLCYYGNWQRDLQTIVFPVVTFRLAKGVQIDLGVEGLFHQESNDIFCLAVASAEDDTALLGMLAQQYYNVGFDIDAKIVYFQNIDCRFYES